MAIAAFMRTIVSTDSRWTRFQSGDQSAFNEQERRGFEIFSQKAKCTNCHDSILLTDMQFHNVGIGMSAASPDPGRGKITSQERDTGAFKTPTLLDVSKSAPYFHDGSVATLEEAVDLMLAGGIPNQWLDEVNLAETKSANLTAQEKADLLAFLRALDVNYNIEMPQLP
jgi:cytochrome c peroxidase